MSQEKRKDSHSEHKAVFCSKPKQKRLAVSQPESANASSNDWKVLSILLCRKSSIQLSESQKHRQFQLTVSQPQFIIRLFKHELSCKILMNPY